MKAEKEMLDLLLKFADNHSDIRLLAMNGSRVNSKIPDDTFKDYDVVFFTDEIAKYKNHPTFLAEFGEIMFMTEPEKGLFPPTFLPDEGYIYLVQYLDGNRIDFQFRVLKHLGEYLQEDSLTKILVDKDQRLTEKVVPDDSVYWVVKPTPEIIQASIAEFWWQNLNTLKALARNELTLAFFYLTISREEVLRLLTWKVALSYGFDRSYGKHSHQILALLAQEEAALFAGTYSGLSILEMVGSLKNMGKIVEKIIPELEQGFTCSYKTYGKTLSLYLESHGETALLNLLKEV